MRRYNKHVAAPLTITASGNSGPLPNLAQADVPIVAATLAVNGVVAGTTPSIVFSLDVSTDNGLTWFSVAQSTAITATGAAQRIVATNVIEPLVRLSWTVTGTGPSFAGVSYTLGFN